MHRNKSFGHFVGGNLQRERNSQSERLRGLEVDVCITGKSAGFAPWRIGPVLAPTCQYASPYLIGSSPLAKTIGTVEVDGERP
jgi:hypothetical protein